MPRRSQQSSDPAELLAQLKGLLDSFSEHLGEPDLRTKVKALAPATHKLRDLGCSLLPDTIDNARDRVMAYLLAYPRMVIDGDELTVVSGIQEWARRLRELRVQFGWRVYSGDTLRDLIRDDEMFAQSFEAEFGVMASSIKRDQYILASDEQDRDAAHRWHLLNTIRRRRISVKDKLLEFMKQNVGKQVTGEELRYLAKSKTEWARRSRELRTEDGWAIATRQSGRPDLPVGTYLLEHDRQAEPHDRHISDDIRVAVLERDSFSCTQCGWTRADVRPEDPRRFLELHHRIHHVDGGTNTADNLITLCNVHHDAIHRSAF